MWIESRMGRSIWPNGLDIDLIFLFLITVDRIHYCNFYVKDSEKMTTFATIMYKLIFL